LYNKNRRSTNKKGEALIVIEETEAITGLSTVLAVVDNDDGTCDVTLNSKDNTVKLLQGIEMNDVEYVSLIFSDTTVVSIMKLPSYIEDQEIIKNLQSKGTKKYSLACISKSYSRYIVCSWNPLREMCISTWICGTTIDNRIQTGINNKVL